MASDLRALRKALKDAGAELARAKSHQVWMCPAGHVVSVLPVTPSEGGHRAYKNTVRDIRRVVRERNCEYAVAVLRNLGERVN